MVYTPSLIYPDFNIFQWSTPSNPNPRLARPIGAADTTIYFTSAPLDHDGNIITGNFLMGIRDDSTYVETVYVPAGEVSVDGLSATNVIRGVRLEGLDYTTGDSSLAKAFFQDSPIFCNVQPVLQKLLVEKNVFPVFADETERDAEIPSPIIGRSTAYLESPGLHQVYNSSGWQDLDTGTVTPNMSTTVAGKGEKGTATEVRNGTATGGTGAPNVVTADILQDTGVSVASSAGAGDAGKLVKTNGSGVLDNTFISNTPVVRTYATQDIGASNTRFDITNPSGTTFRYTYDGTGTDPGIDSTTVPAGSTVMLWGTGMATGNEGVFTVTNSGTNFFEVTNASGVAETNKTLGSNGVLQVAPVATWSKPTGIKRVIVEVVGGGGGADSASTSSTGVTAYGASGGGGGYSRKTIEAASLGATETVTVGIGGVGAYPAGALAATDGGTTSFGSYISATGGGAPASDYGGVGGIGSNGDFNINGGGGSSNGAGLSSSTAPGGVGGSSFYGGGANAPSSPTSAGSRDGIQGGQYGGGGSGGIARSSGSSSTAAGGPGYGGIVIVTEQFI